MKARKKRREISILEEVEEAAWSLQCTSVLLSNRLKEVWVAG
jgi:hypothetical protein